jgi:hypothetical protein
MIMVLRKRFGKLRPRRILGRLVEYGEEKRGG